MSRNPKEYPCELSPTGKCRYGGGKSFNYGFVYGIQSWCREPKTNRAVFPFVGADLICPLYGAKNTEQQVQADPTDSLT